MTATAGNRLTLDPMGKCSNAFFSETTNMIKAKLHYQKYNRIKTENGKAITYYMQAYQAFV
jgi:hypothetical protein